MKIVWSLCRFQCRCFGILGLSGLLLLSVVLMIGQLAAGLEVAFVLSPRNWLGSLTILLPEFLQVLLPICLAHTFMELFDGGELQAARSAGAAPLLIVGGLLAPLVPIVLLIPILVHDARPAALLEARRAALSAPAAWSVGLEQLGVGMVRSESAFRAMLRLGERVLAVTASAPPDSRGGDGSDLRRPGAGLVLRAGNIQVSPALGEPAATGVSELRFERLDLAFGPVDPGLSVLPVTALSSGFLAGQSVRWRRARLRWEGRDSGREVRREMRRRSSSLPALLVGLGLVVGLLGWRRGLTPRFVYGVCAPVAVLASLFGSRLPLGFLT